MSIPTINKHRTESATFHSPWIERVTGATNRADDDSTPSRHLRCGKCHHHPPCAPQALPLSRPAPTRPFEGGGDPGSAINAQTGKQVVL